MKIYYLDFFFFAFIAYTCSGQAAGYHVDKEDEHAEAQYNLGGINILKPEIVDNSLNSGDKNNDECKNASNEENVGKFHFYTSQDYKKPRNYQTHQQIYQAQTNLRFMLLTRSIRHVAKDFFVRLTDAAARHNNNFYQVTCCEDKFKIRSCVTMSCICID